MKLFECQNCGQRLYFENTLCERCGHLLGYLAEQVTLSALTRAGGETWRALAMPGECFRFCANAAHNACNWLVPAASKNVFCRACELNRTIPDLDSPRNRLLWRRLESAKHNLVYGLIRFRLPLSSRFSDPERGLAFDFLAGPDDSFQAQSQVSTGHAAGVITIDIAEADPAERERNRQDMLEPYRTLLGHFRHEIGHYYWERLVHDEARHRAFRAVFGDERQDYVKALDSHYRNGPRLNWQEQYVSCYAGAHPWEDFAESWAHYMHIVDTLETAASFGVRVRATAGRHPVLEMEIDFDPYEGRDFDALMAAWYPLTYAVNSLNQSMGQPDLYPFVLAPAAVGKLRFVHRLIHGLCGTGE
ncbi:zinc-binding metallopeptidase family protein [Nisaea sediminum]|uniref:zinc-binding metallopeptidase family protein n=1 Tax=Nisaea sediminum TaxID=2775867 RepID=UPI001866F452|nr:putative zinc-binding peptidase [Nisaea sediminum]